MLVSTAAALLALVSAAAVALVVNRTLKRGGMLALFRRTVARNRATPWSSDAGRRGGGLAARAAQPGRQAWERIVFVTNLVLLCGGGLSMALALPYEGAFALSQALLLLFLLYPLALFDLLTLTVEAPLVVLGLALRLASVLLLERGVLLESLGGMLGGAGLLYLIGFAYEALRHRPGIGEGDPAVLALIGGFVGWQGVLPVVLVSTATGLAIGAPALLLLRKSMNTPLPFAPFLCAGGLAVYVAQACGWLAWYTPF